MAVSFLTVTIVALPSSTVRSPELHGLLIQRAVQSTCFTARQCRDAPTAQWLGSFLGHDGLETFHGIGGLRVGWDEYLSSLLRAPCEHLTVYSVLKKNRGLSANNPFLQPSSMEFEHDIKPSLIASRVIDTACLIASEWCEDLTILADDAEPWLRRGDELTGQTDAHQRRMPAFMNDRSGDGSGDGSPFRGGNYDLLKVLLTRQAARRQRDELDGLPSRASALLDAVLEAHPCRGELPFGSADALVSSLLEQPCAVRADATFVDPFEVAAKLFDTRRELAAEWTEQLARVPDAVLDVKRRWLAEGFDV